MVEYNIQLIISSKRNRMCFWCYCRHYIVEELQYPHACRQKAELPNVYRIHINVHDILQLDTEVEPISFIDRPTIFKTKTKTKSESESET